MECDSFKGLVFRDKKGVRVIISFSNTIISLYLATVIRSVGCIVVVHNLSF